MMIRGLAASLLCLLLTACVTGGKTTHLEGQDSLRAEWEPRVAKIREISPNRGLRVNQVIRKVAFGSCMDQNLPQPVWEALNQDKPDLFIALGDNVYASASKDKPISEMYLRQLQNPQLLEFRKNVPWVGVWDDHDFGVNDGGGDHPEFEEAKASFLAFLPNSDKVIPPDQKGNFHSIIIGNKPSTLQLIMLDTRTYRSELKIDPDPNPLKRYLPHNENVGTILGEKQWAWLENELQKPANLRVLVSSIQVLPQEHGFEKWQNHPHERERLINLIKRFKLKNIVILSGDRHISEVSKLRLSKRNQLVEVTSSALNKGSSLKDEPNKLRSGQIYGKPNYGIFEIDYGRRRLNYIMKSVDGEVLKNTRINF